MKAAIDEFNKLGSMNGGKGAPFGNVGRLAWFGGLADVLAHSSLHPFVGDFEVVVPVRDGLNCDRHEFGVAAA